MPHTPHRSNWQGPQWEIREDGELHATEVPAAPRKKTPKRDWLEIVTIFLCLCVLVSVVAPFFTRGMTREAAYTLLAVSFVPVGIFAWASKQGREDYHRARCQR